MAERRFCTLIHRRRNGGSGGGMTPLFGQNFRQNLHFSKTKMKAAKYSPRLEESKSANKFIIRGFELPTKRDKVCPRDLPSPHFSWRSQGRTQGGAKAAIAGSWRVGCAPSSQGAHSTNWVNIRTRSYRRSPGRGAKGRCSLAGGQWAPLAFDLLMTLSTCCGPRPIFTVFCRSAEGLYGTLKGPAPCERVYRFASI